MGVRGWGHPISVRAWRSGIISLAIVKRLASSASAADDMMFMMIWAMVKKPASSASAADDMTFLMIWAIVGTGPL